MLPKQDSSSSVFPTASKTLNLTTSEGVSSAIQAIYNEDRLDYEFINNKRKTLATIKHQFHQWSLETLEEPSRSPVLPNAWKEFNLPELLRTSLAYPLSSLPLPSFTPTRINPLEELLVDPNSFLSSPANVIKESDTPPPIRSALPISKKKITKKGFDSYAFNPVVPSKPRFELAPPSLLFANFVPNKIYMAKLKLKNIQPQLIQVSIDSLNSSLFHYDEFYIYSSSTKYTLAMGMVAEYEVYFKPSDALTIQAEFLFRVDESLNPYKIRCENKPPELQIKELSWYPPEFHLSQQLRITLFNRGGTGNFTTPSLYSFTLPSHQSIDLFLDSSHQGSLELQCQNGSKHVLPLVLPPVQPEITVSTPDLIFKDISSILKFQVWNHSQLHFEYEWCIEPPCFTIQPSTGRFSKHSALLFQCYPLSHPLDYKNGSFSFRSHATATLKSIENKVLATVLLHMLLPQQQLTLFPTKLQRRGRMNEPISLPFYIYSTYDTNLDSIELHLTDPVSFLTWDFEGPTCLERFQTHAFQLICTSLWPMTFTNLNLAIRTSLYTLNLPIELEIVGIGITLSDTNTQWTMLMDTPTTFSIQLFNTCQFEVPYELFIPYHSSFLVSRCDAKKGILPPLAKRNVDVWIVSNHPCSVPITLECVSWCEGIESRDSCYCEWHSYTSKLNALLPKVDCMAYVPTSFTLTLINPVPIAIPFHLCSNALIEWNARWGWVPPLGTVWVEGQVCSHVSGDVSFDIPCIDTTLVCQVKPLELNLSLMPLTKVPLFKTTPFSICITNPYDIQVLFVLNLAKENKVFSFHKTHQQTELNMTLNPLQKLLIPMYMTPSKEEEFVLDLQLKLFEQPTQWVHLGTVHGYYESPIKCILNTPHQLYLKNTSLEPCSLNCIFWPSIPTITPFLLLIPSKCTRVLHPPKGSKYLFYDIQGYSYPPSWTHSVSKNELAVMQWIEKYPTQCIVLAREVDV